MLESFGEQIDFLERSNDSFDQGHLSEAKRLAVTLRVLFHHTADNHPRGSHALLNQLDLRDKLTWVDSAGMPHPKNLAPTLGLVLMGIDIGEGNASYQAPLGDRPPTRIRTTVGNLPRGSRIYTDAWWANPVSKDSDGTLFCRKDFVLALANQEGGAHVDPQIKAAYDKIANSNSMGWVHRKGDAEEIPLSNPVPYAVRQISYEVVESVRQQRDRIK
ncbi:hypothetical protein A5686_06440 [Mycobacterium sp. E2479]|nr:hypothetical protein A5686_06440 [Mycobacterium sp. E2479]